MKEVYEDSDVEDFGKSTTKEKWITYTELTICFGVGIFIVWCVAQLAALISNIVG